MYDHNAQDWYVYVVNTTSWFEVGKGQITYPAERLGPFTYPEAERRMQQHALAQISYEPQE